MRDRAQVYACWVGVARTIAIGLVVPFEFKCSTHFGGRHPEDRVLTSGPRDLRGTSADEQEILRSAGRTALLSMAPSREAVQLLSLL